MKYSSRIKITGDMSIDPKFGINLLIAFKGGAVIL
tara:strand:- start:215 stop:319 length:105 start_codon:yes stop_codon:yes gene_type:complete